MRVSRFRRQTGESAGVRRVYGKRAIDPIRCRRLIHSYDSEIADSASDRGRTPDDGGTDPHGGDLTIDGRSVPCLSDSQIKERKQTKNVRQGGVYPVVICGVVIADVIEFRD